MENFLLCSVDRSVKFQSLLSAMVLSSSYINRIMFFGIINKCFAIVNFITFLEVVNYNSMSNLKTNKNGKSE